MRRRTIRHILRKMSGLGRRATETLAPEHMARLGKIANSYAQQLARARPRIGRWVYLAPSAPPPR